MGWINKDALDFEKIFAFKKSRFGSFYSVKTTYLAFLVLFYKAWFCIENFITCQILNWKKYNASDFDLKELERVRFWKKFFFVLSDFQWKFLQRVRFWNKNNTTRQILTWKFYNASDFGYKKLQHVGLWIKNFSTCHISKSFPHSKNHVLIHFTPWKRHILHLSWFFKKHDFVLKISLRVRFWIEKKIQRLRFWIEKNTTRQILNWKKNTTRQIMNWKKYNASDFELEKIQLDRFRIKFFSSCQIFNKKTFNLNF